VDRNPENDIRDGSRFETPRETLPTTMEVDFQIETSAELTPREAAGEVE
jgi:hypothetical protein